MGLNFDICRWDRIREDSRAWWEGSLERPLLQVRIGGVDPGRPEPELPRRHFAAHYGLGADPEQIVDRWDYDLSCQEFLGDAFPAVFVNFGPGIAAGFLGGKVECDDRTVWFHPREPADIEDLHFEYDPDNPWLRHIKRLCRMGVERWEGKAQISMTDLGGAVDILASFRPGEELLTDLILHPSEVSKCIGEIHRQWFRYYDEINEVLQPVNPGYTAWAPIFSETTYYMLQCDFCYMIGPHHFDEFVKPELEAACARLDHPFYHLDGPGQLCHLDSLLQIEDLAGVQWVPGAGQKPTSEWPEVYRKIRDAGKLIQLLSSGEPIKTLEMVSDQLGSTEGIVMLAHFPANRREEALEWLENYGVPGVTSA